MIAACTQECAGVVSRRASASLSGGMASAAASNVTLEIQWGFDWITVEEARTLDNIFIMCCLGAWLLMQLWLIMRVCRIRSAQAAATQSRLHLVERSDENSTQYVSHLQKHTMRASWRKLNLANKLGGRGSSGTSPGARSRRKEQSYATPAPATDAAGQDQNQSALPRPPHHMMAWKEIVIQHDGARSRSFCNRSMVDNALDTSSMADEGGGEEK